MKNQIYQPMQLTRPQRIIARGSESVALKTSKKFWIPTLAVMLACSNVACSYAAETNGQSSAKVVEAEASNGSSNEIVVVLNNTGNDSFLPVDAGEYLLVANDQSEEATEANTQHLQTLVDAVSDAGGGTISLPAGTYYFAPLYANYESANTILTDSDTNHMERHVVKCRDNVTIQGAGCNENTGTVLRPIGTYDFPTDMFYFNDIVEIGEANYLVNAHFSDFVIDSADVHNSGTYNAKGKGFFINLLSDCTWNNVEVRNTDGTGIGIDCPIRCSITNCTISGCGKGTTLGSIGGSGIGIGYGYSSEESITIDSCTVLGNQRFGIFFENQSRFTEYYEAESHGEFLISNCVARGNGYDFGGEYSEGLTYVNCTCEARYSTDPNPLDVTTNGRTTSIRNRLITPS